MTDQIVRLGPEYFPRPTSGIPVAGGSIYIGEPDTDPEIPANQITVSALQENGSTVVISQPILTGGGGVPLYNGSPVTLLVSESYSLKILDSFSAQVYYVPDTVVPVDTQDPVVEYIKDLIGLINVSSPADDDTYTVLSYFDGLNKGGGNFYWESTTDKATANGGTVIDPDNIAGFDGTIPTRDAFLAAQGTGVGSGCWIREETGASVHWWGAVGDDTTDDTLAIQAAIDYVLASGLMVVYAPSGHYKFSALIFRNAAGSGRELRGKITLRGDGQLSQADVYGSTNERYGTIFESTLTTAANALVVSNNDTVMRSVRLDSLSIIYGGTGYAVQAEYCPEVDLNAVSVRCTAAGSKALFLKDVWHGRVKRLITFCDIAVTSTVPGVVFSAGVFSGSFKFEDCIIDHFNDCVSVASGSAFFTNLTFENCSIERYHRYGWFIEGPMWNFMLRDCYTETESATTCIKVDPNAGTIANLRIDGLFILGGTATEAWLTGPAIELTNVDQYIFRSIKYFRSWTSLLNLVSGVTYGTVDGVNIHHDGVANLPAGPLYMFTADSSDNFAISNYTITDTTKLELLDETADSLSSFDSLGARVRSLSHGPTVFTSTSATVYSMGTALPQPMVVFVTAGGAGDGGVKLPGITQDGDVRYVYCDVASAHNIDVRNSANVSIGVVLAPGEGCICHADIINTKWVVSKTGAVTYGP